MALARARQLIGRAISPFYRHQTFVWMWSPVRDRDRGLTLPDGFRLIRASEADLPLLEQLDTGFDRAAEFLAAGHRLWLLCQGERVVYASWTFLGVAPTPAARSGWIALPAGFVHPEDSTTHPDHRGQGVAGLAGGLIHQAQVQDGWKRYVFCALTTNTSSLRASAKRAARAFALVEVTKIGLLRSDAGWRNRRADTPLTYTRVRITQPEVPGGPTPADEELLDWFRSAVRAGVPGPGPAARPTREAVATA